MDEQRVHPNVLAAKLGVTREAVYKMLKKPHLNSARLIEISHIVGHDFLQYLQKDNGAREQHETVMQENMKLKKLLEECEKEKGVLKMQVSYLEEQVKGQKELIAMLRK